MSYHEKITMTNFNHYLRELFLPWMDEFLNYLNMEWAYKWKLSGSARQSEIGTLRFDWLIHPGVSYSREIWIFSEQEGSYFSFLAFFV